METRRLGTRSRRSAATRMHSPPVRLVLCAALLFTSAVHCQEERGPALPEGQGKELTALVCSQCHGLKETAILRDGQRGWEEVVNRMVLYGAQLSPSEAQLVTGYLATYLGPGSGAPPAETGPGRGAMAARAFHYTLPVSPGHELVADRCALCHTLEKVVSSSRTNADWESITRDMLARGMVATPPEMKSMILYLQTNFSKGSAPHRAITGNNLSESEISPPGNSRVRFDEKSDATSQRNPSGSFPAPSREGDLAQGKDVFTQKCFGCHSVLANQVRLGPSLFAEMKKPHPKMTELQVRKIVQNGKGKMPAFKDLSGTEIENLLAYIRTL